MLKGQAALSAVLYVLLLPLAILLLRYVGWPIYLIWWFAPLLLLEYFNQEIYRLLIALSQQISASLLLFMRQGSWGLVIVALMAWCAESRNLNAVMALWAFSGVVTAALGIVKLRKLRMGGWRLPIDWGWIRKGVVLSAAFLGATLALRGIQTVDRYWLEALGGIQMVGAYVLFLGIAGTLLVFLDAGVFAYACPELIRLAHDGEHALARKRMWQILLQTLALCVAFAFVSWLVLPFLLDWIGDPVYKNAIRLYPWILMAMTINALGMVPHYVLYAYGKDRSIIASHLVTLPVFGLSTWLVGMFQPLLAVPIGLGASFILILVWKTVACWRLGRNTGMATSS